MRNDYFGGACKNKNIFAVFSGPGSACTLNFTTIYGTLTLRFFIFVKIGKHELTLVILICLIIDHKYHLIYFNFYQAIIFII